MARQPLRAEIVRRKRTLNPQILLRLNVIYVRFRPNVNECCCPNDKDGNSDRSSKREKTKNIFIPLHRLVDADCGERSFISPSAENRNRKKVEQMTGHKEKANDER